MSDADKTVQEDGRGTRLAVTALIAIGAVALLFAVAAVTLLLIGELLRGQWLLAGIAAVALVALYLLAKRFLRVAVNQNANPLG